jgi:hypothetical protein
LILRNLQDEFIDVYVVKPLAVICLCLLIGFALYWYAHAAARVGLSTMSNGHAQGPTDLPTGTASIRPCDQLRRPDRAVLLEGVCVWVGGRLWSRAAHALSLQVINCEDNLKHRGYTWSESQWSNLWCDGYDLYVSALQKSAQARRSHHTRPRSSRFDDDTISECGAMYNASLL